MQSTTGLERHASVFGLRVRISLVGRGGDLDRLGDAEHAAIVELLAGWLRREGLAVQAEVSFSEWGDRGRIDPLGWGAATGTLVLVEVKTELTDLQDLFGRLDVKQRLVARIAARRGWAAQRQLTVLAIEATSLNRRIVRSHSALFEAFAVRRLARSTVQTPGRALVWIPASRAGRPAWIAARQRVRVRSATGR